MRRVTILCVGRMKERFYADAAAEYARRLSRFCDLEIAELPEQRLPEDPSPAEVERALAREAEAIRARLPAGALTVAMCVDGKLMDSEAFASLLSPRESVPVAFLVGGSFGLHGSVKAAARMRLSLSPMTFPHHLARVMLLEQIYRGFQIVSGGKYHK